MSSDSFSSRLVDWQKKHGRHDLPWQRTRDPYWVWLSEIMLQQTQVVTVKDYFTRFVARYPTVADLAAAHEDEVLALWSGLGYYSRARNLHRAAQQVVHQHAGVFPKRAELLQTLPGVGPSTAAAIASICFGERVAILDGNVKRVLTRHLGFAEDLAYKRHETLLWHMAQERLPCTSADMPTYTQAIMDLGAGVCTPKRPQCEVCPVRSDCVAHAQDAVFSYPVKTRKLKRQTQSWWLLLACTATGDVWLQQRPHTGVWAKLYALPMFESVEALMGTVPANYRAGLEHGEVLKHVLTHRDLYLHPITLWLPTRQALGEGQWVRANDWPQLGLPAPIRKLLETLSRAR